MRTPEPRRRLPAVGAVVEAAAAGLRRQAPAGDVDALRPAMTAFARARLEALREWVEALEGGGEGLPTTDGVADAVRRELGELLAGRLRPAINATGVILHTNLGRAPLSEASLARVVAVAAGYSTLELEPPTGRPGPVERSARRGQRARSLDAVFKLLLGAPAVVVNNNAASLLLVLAALARGREVVVSRGELIEIGGSFRLPDVMRAAGARLVEVGTTNRTRLADYAAAIGPRTALLLKVHTSNYRVVGFAESVGMAELARLAAERGVPAVEDLGSGALLDTAEAGLAHEPTVAEALAAGADLVCFSGDKLLGGPQAGIVAGREELVARLAKHPLYRALRPDKLHLAALEATLSAYLRGRARDEIPVWRMLLATSDGTRGRTESWVAALAGHTGGMVAEVIEVESTVGGGALPGETLPGFGLALGADRAGGGGAAARRLAARLAAGDPPVIARIDRDRVILDPRTVLPEQDESLLTALRGALSADPASGG